MIFWIGKLLAPFPELSFLRLAEYLSARSIGAVTWKPGDLTVVRGARAAELQRTRASDYGRRSPNEWFAELFSLYFAEGGAPGWPLRRANPELRWVAEFFDERLGEELGVTRSG